MQTVLIPSSIDDYRTFLRIKRLPAYRFRGRVATYPDEYASRLNVDVQPCKGDWKWSPPEWMFDYQAAITRIALEKRKYAVFADCGLGKTACFLEYAREVCRRLGTARGVLLVSPLNVIGQTIEECERFYGQSFLEQVAPRNLQSWLDACGGKIGITNYEGLKDGLTRGQLGALILDESSMLKSHYGKWGQVCLQLGKGLDWKLCGTGTPAPNDRIEFANHAVHLDHFPTVNSFLATFFVNRGQTDNRWELKPHALKPFYRALSHWSIFLTNPATYGWQDNTDPLPPINVHIADVEMTDAQRSAVREETGGLFAAKTGGICNRSVLSQIGKGNHRGSAVATRKPQWIADAIASWPSESTIVWCLYNDEQRVLERTLPNASSIDGSTPQSKRMQAIEGFRRGEIKTIISKPKIMGFGLNLQICTRMIFSGLQDSYESYYQCVKRANRYGSTRPLNVHIPVTDAEAPMVENVLRKAHMVAQDTEEQERLFKLMLKQGV